MSGSMGALAGLGRGEKGVGPAELLAPRALPIKGFGSSAEAAQAIRNILATMDQVEASLRFSCSVPKRGKAARLMRQAGQRLDIARNILAGRKGSEPVRRVRGIEVAKQIAIYKELQTAFEEPLQAQ